MFWDVFYSVLMLLTGIGIFLVGIVMFSGVLEKLASRKMRGLFKKISNNRFAGMGVGAAVTTVIQSSTATSVMTIGLVNAGILTLFQATSIIMGANIGSSVSSLLVALSAFNIKFFFMVMAFIGAFIKIFTKKERWVKAADLLISFGILFVGLQLMGDAFSNSAALRDAFMNLFEAASFPLLLILLGAVFTAIIQSVSAATAIFIAMISNGALVFSSALYLVIGANMGAVIVAVIASLSGNANAKRTALIKVLINVIGVVFMTALIWPLSSVFLPWFERIIPDPVWQLSVFHIIFNVGTTLLLIWFIKPLNALATKLIKDKPIPSTMQPEFIEDRFLALPLLALEHVKEEIAAMAVLVKENLDRAFQAWTQATVAEKDKQIKQENRVDFLYHALSKYLVKIPRASVPRASKGIINSYYHVIDNLERVSDDSVSIIFNAERMEDRHVVLPVGAVAEFNEMYENISRLFDLCLEAIHNGSVTSMRAANRLIKEIEKKETSLAENFITETPNETEVEINEYIYTGIISFGRSAEKLLELLRAVHSYTKKPSKKKKKEPAEIAAEIEKLPENKTTEE